MPALKMMGIISSFKLKNHLIQLYRTHKTDCLFIIRHRLLKGTSKTIQDHLFHFCQLSDGLISQGQAPRIISASKTLNLSALESMPCAR